MKTKLLQLIALICIIASQPSITFADGHSSSNGDGSENEILLPMSDKNSATENLFHKVMKRFNTSKVPATVGFKTEIETNRLFYRINNLIFVNSSGDSIVHALGLSVQHHDEGFGKKYNNIFGSSFGILEDPIIVTLQNEDTVELSNNVKIKLRYLKENGTKYIVGLITTDNRGKCSEVDLNYNPNAYYVDLDFKAYDGVCAVFYAWNQSQN